MGNFRLPGMWLEYILILILVVLVIAHELGHAYHNHCAFEAGKTELQRSTPMTMAETASILCETIIMQAVLKQVSDPQEELAILE